MKLTTKLMIAFMTIITVPVIIVYVCMGVLQRYQVKKFQNAYQTENIFEMFVGNSVQALNSLTADIQEQIQAMLEESPDELLEEETLQSLQVQLNEWESFLIIEKGQQIVYDGSEGKMAVPESELLDSDGGSFDEGGTYLSGDTNCFVKQQGTVFSDGEDGTVFIVTRAGLLLPQVKQLAGSMVVVVGSLLILIAFCLTMWIYYTLLRPIAELQRATKAIKDGNLDYQLDLDDKDEIGQLCSNFEEMRQRLKESQEEKLQYDRENKELISNISHDLKTPITAIKGYVEGIMDGVASSPEMLDKYVRTIYNKANDMDRLIDELTFYSKIDTNKIPYAFEKINVKEYFDDCVEEIGLYLETQNIKVTYRNMVDGRTMIIADAEQLKRVVNNIVGNSVKYMDKPAKVINFDIQDVGDFIQVNIADNGRGVSVKELPKIFERFYRTDASRNSSKGGSGIGLSIVKKIIQDHGGQIWATGAEGQGLTMHFVLRKYQEVPNE
jgi:signal transduction histidine kinase